MTAAVRMEIREDQQSPLEACLAIWVRWHHRDDMSLNWRGRAALLASDSCLDTEQLYDAMDNKTAVAVDACVASLSLSHGWAIRRRCNLATAWRFPRLVFADVLAAAECELEKKLRNNVATRNLFD